VALVGKRNIVMIGASAGGIEPLQQIVSRLPSNFPGSLFVTLHIPAWHKSGLPTILSRSGPLPAKHPVSGELIQPGHIYVAPPDHHLLLDSSGKVQLWRGPKENRHRPSINASFRSAAVAYQDQVIGMILSGMLDDGVTGLWWIKRFGGLTVVQDPHEAEFADMPQMALEHVEVDYVEPAAKIGRLITELTQDESRLGEKQA
jgi:two-component system chemotaxis response regulator CheB